MLNRLFGSQFHQHFYYFVLLLFFIGVCCSTFLMSMGLFLGGLNFLLQADFKFYWMQLRTNRLFWLITLFYGLHLIGLLWTSDFQYGCDDIRKKATLLVIPLLMCSHDLPPKRIRYRLLLTFVATLLITSLINFIAYLFYREQMHIIDIRGLSLFGSHIRYGILIALGTGISVELANYYARQKWFFLALIPWFLFYTYFSQVLSGVVAMIIVLAVILLFRFSIKMRLRLSIISAILLLGTSYFIVHYLSQPINYTFKNKNELTLSLAWNQRSAIHYDSLDQRQQKLSTTLQRYLSSKNLDANGKGVAALDKYDIRNIEEGFADIHETENGLMARLYGIRFQLHNAENPNGHSILERIEFWKNSWQIIQKNWLMGVGTGDVQQEILKMYEKRNSPLSEEHRLRTHNSYLTFWLTFGIFGLLYFIYLQWTFLRFQWNNQNMIGVMFILVAFGTFFFEDTLETQMGITFFALFYAFFSRQQSESTVNTQ